MVYQDHLTKFCVLRAVKSKRPVEIASQLLDIFLLFGAPAILQSDNGTEFTANVICELKEFWPALKMVHGKPRYPQSQGSVERANGDIKDMLVAWLTDNESQDWVAGIKFVQFQKNSSHHAGIKRSPYSALFGNEARVGLTTSSLPREILDNLESEQDLARLDLASAESPAPSTDTGLTSVEPTPLASSLDEPVPTAFSSDEPAPTASSSAEPAPTAISSAETGPSSTDTTSNSSESAPPSATETDNDLTVHVERIKRARKAASAGQLSQAERMVKRSRVDFKSGEVGDNVAVPVPLVDRGRGDARNILGVILNRDISTDTYTIGVKAGVLKGGFSRNQFDLCPQRLLNNEDICLDKVISLRSAVIAESASGGQGFTKCNCVHGKKRCGTNKCSCFRNDLKCNSKCHSSLTCPNK